MVQTVPFLAPKTVFMVCVTSSVEIVSDVMQIIKGKHAIKVCVQIL